ncbi:MAG: hypothetical protein HYX52_09490 [Chloroflexi bacterium]|nr:hypothetical protein [Chloroflexota bacterium]
MSVSIWLGLALLLVVGMLSYWRVRPRDSWRDVASGLGLAALLSGTAAIVILWPLFYVGADTYLGAVNPDYFASFRDNYYLGDNPITATGAEANSYAPFVSQAGNIRLSARFSSALFAMLLESLLRVPPRTALTLAIGIFVVCLPLTVFFMVRVALGGSMSVARLSAVLIGLSGPVAMSYIYFYVGQNSALSMTPLLLTVLFILITKPSVKILLFSAVLLSSMVVMYMGMLPYAVAPVGLLALYLMVRRRLSLVRAIAIGSSLLLALVLVNIGMLQHMLSVVLGWQNIVGQALQGQYFIDFATEQFFPIFLGLAVYPVNASLPALWFGQDWTLVALLLSFGVAMGLAVCFIDWARKAPDGRHVVLVGAAIVVYSGAWWFYTFTRLYPYAVFKMAAWLQFMLVPLFAYGLWRLWDLARRAGRTWRQVVLYGCLASAGLLVVGGNLLSSVEYGRKGLGRDPGAFIVNAFEMSGNADYLNLSGRIQQVVKPGESIGLAMTDSILNNWVGYYLRDFNLSYLSHQLFPGDDEALPDIETRLYVDYYGNLWTDDRPFFNGATDTYYLTLNDNSLNADIINQKLPEPLWRDSTFSLIRAADAPGFMVTGRGFYRLEHLLAPNPSYWWPRTFRWTRDGGEVYMLRAAQPGKPYRLSFVGIAGYGANTARRTIEVWANDQKIDEVLVDGSARVLSAPFYPTGDVDRLVLRVKEDVALTPRPFALWNKAIPADYRGINLAVADIQVLAPGETVPALALNESLVGRDIFTRGILFNGIEPDGWVRDALTLTLVRPTGSTELSLSVVVPGVPEFAFPFRISVDVDGVSQTIEVPAPGPATLVVPIPTAVVPTETTVTVSPGQSFSPPWENQDRRPRVQSVRFDSMQFGVGAADVQLQLAPGIAATAGIDADGWMLRAGALTVEDAASRRTLELDFEIPGWAEVDGVNVWGLAGGQPFPSQTFGPGMHTLRIPLPPSVGAVPVTLNADSVFQIPAPDTRSSSLRILGARLVEPSPVPPRGN